MLLRMTEDKMMQGIIDRFEGEMAVIETDNDTILIARQDLPAGAGEGDLVKKLAEGWIVDKQASSSRQKQIKKLAEELFDD